MKSKASKRRLVRAEARWVKRHRKILKKLGK